jgi:hypothetical protein
MSRERIAKRTHEEREGGRVMVTPAVVISDLIKRKAAPDRPASTKKDLYVALSEPNGFIFEQRQIRQAKRRNDSACKKLAPAQSGNHEVTTRPPPTSLRVEEKASPNLSTHSAAAAL